MVKQKQKGRSGISRTKLALVAGGVYLAIGLVWSLVMLATTGSGSQPGPSIASQFVSVGLTSVLWLPLMLISALG